MHELCHKDYLYHLVSRRYTDNIRQNKSSYLNFNVRISLKKRREISLTTTIFELRSQVAPYLIFRLHKHGIDAQTT